MAKLPFIFLVVFFHVHFAESDYPPSIIGFGDSLIDTGNNNFLPTLAKCNYLPYGIDFPNKILGFNLTGDPTGRFTNCYNIIDLIATYLNLSSPTPYYSIQGVFSTNMCVNFASGSCGILDDTGIETGACSNFVSQINNFQNAKNMMALNFKHPDDLDNYLSKCLCVVVIGNNDYLNNYFRDFILYLAYQTYNCTQFAEILADKISQNLQRLYQLGCKKFVIANAASVGCTPNERRETGIPAMQCNNTQNNCVAIYNSMLKSQVLPYLKSNLPGFDAVHMDIWTPVRNCTLNPASCGFNTSSVPCCNIFLNGTCIPVQAPCPDRTKNMFWDGFHPVQAFYDLMVKGCFNTSNSYPCDRPIGSLVYD
ncbi:hypothetical protein Droror1_Dr00024366 [Drosera rotundifolia]